LCCEATPQASSEEEQTEKKSSSKTKEDLKADNTAAYYEIIGYFNKKNLSNSK
jgi:hypothetical protein